MDMLGKVRRMKMREKLTISEIAKRTGLARNTLVSFFFVQLNTFLGGIKI